MYCRPSKESSSLHTAFSLVASHSRVRGSIGGWVQWLALMQIPSRPGTVPSCSLAMILNTRLARKSRLYHILKELPQGLNDQTGRQ